ncbi:acetyltransferase [Coprinopsis cinerea AmutBmut pab1-1]|nr:acetyltransferase [Coprinopsis cinerea AmutBmut pab1-1]
MSVPATGQFYPLQMHLQNGEPFLRLKKHKNVIITPPRMSDACELCSMTNHPLVFEWSEIPRLPVTLEETEIELKTRKATSDQTLCTLQAAQDGPEFLTVGFCPVDTLRLVLPSGTDTLIGSIFITRCEKGEFLSPAGPSIVDWENRLEHLEDNSSLDVGDPDIVWSLGFYLSPKFHGQGIMSDAVNTLLHDWAIPRMGVRRMLVFTFQGNHGSVKTLLKNGFKFLWTSEDHYEVRGIRRSVNVLEWKLEDDES